MANSLLLHLVAPNDGFGNPRRLFILFEDDRISSAWDEAYLGFNSVPKNLKDRAQRATSIKITVNEYQRLKPIANRVRKEAA